MRGFHIFITNNTYFDAKSIQEFIKDNIKNLLPCYQDESKNLLIIIFKTEDELDDWFEDHKSLENCFEDFHSLWIVTNFLPKFIFYPRILGIFVDRDCARINHSIPEEFREKYIASGFVRYVRKNSNDAQYISLIISTLTYGTSKMTRSGECISYFGDTRRYCLKNNQIPVLTTKKIFWKSVVEELLWFLKGRTNACDLSLKGVNIWKANASREFLDSRGLVDNVEGDLGPVYGFQWRHFGASYQGHDADYTDKGIDQISNVINLIKTDPTSRRIVLTAWNPSQIEMMALPPCHMTSIFNVTDGELSCLLLQRSGDVGLGVPFNIASYSLLTHILAYITGTKAKELVHVIADTHIYKSHKEPLLSQIKRIGFTSPSLHFDFPPDKLIDDIEYNDIKLFDYECHPAIKMEMAV